MKNMHIIYVLALLLFSLNWAEAQVIRVDNNEGASADYVKLQDAINQANAGDTIYVVGSPNFYDTNTSGTPVEIRINKQLTIIGPGFFLGENENTQASTQTSKVRDINIGEGADGTTITGMDMSDRNSDIIINRERFDGSTGNDGPSNITISRNKIDELALVDATNTFITQNFFQTSSFAIQLWENASGTVIRNNIISQSSSSGAIYGQNNVNLSNTVIESNTMRNDITRVNGATIQNNIIINGALVDSDDNTVNNNLFTTTQQAVFPESSTGNSSSNNLYSQIISDIFIVPEPEIDNGFRLANNSPAISAGVNSIDLGAFGGVAPYRLSGIPSIPAIYDLTTTGVGTRTDGMQVQIKAKANN